MSADVPSVDYVVDSCDRRCPQPIIDLQNALRECSIGSVLALYSTDSGSVHDIPTWLSLHPHKLLSYEKKESGQYVFYVQKA